MRQRALIALQRAHEAGHVDAAKAIAKHVKAQFSSPIAKTASSMQKTRSTPVPPPISAAQIMRMALGILPGSGDVMAMQESQQAGQEMVDALRGGDYGRAASSGLEAGLLGLGALPFVPAMGGMLLDAKQLLKSRGAIDAAYPPWGSTAFVPGKMTRDVTIYKNPSQREIDRLASQGDLRVILSNDRKTMYVWDAEKALHPEVAEDLGLQRVLDPHTGIYTNDYVQGVIPRK